MLRRAETMGFDTSGVSPAGPDYHFSFVGASNRVLVIVQFGLQQFLKNRSCRQDLS